MKILTSDQIRSADSFTIQHEPIASIDLMERAARRCVEWICEHYTLPREFEIVCGTGNNGGDGLAIARILTRLGCKVKVIVVALNSTSADFRVNEKRATELGIPILKVNRSVLISSFSTEAVVVDALLGSGITREAKGLVAEVIEAINKTKNPVVSIDTPSGLFDVNNHSIDQPIVRSTHTLVFEAPRLSFYLPENEDYVGDWCVLHIGLDQQYLAEMKTKEFAVEASSIFPLFRSRKKYAHKGNFGHAAIVGGSYGKIGAVVLAAKGCLRVGSGLLTVQVPKCGYGILQQSVPEAMCVALDGETYIENCGDLSEYAAIGIGPGMGTEKETVNAFFSVLESVSCPLVLDADAINALAQHRREIENIPTNAVLTPHPKEFERLVGGWKNDTQKLELLRTFTAKTNCFVVLKGANTVICTPDGLLYFNTTGNPALSTGGTGDVLTGMITGFIAQGYSSLDACLLGVFLHGKVADHYVHNATAESMVAGDLPSLLGKVMQDFKSCIK